MRCTRSVAAAVEETDFLPIPTASRVVARWDGQAWTLLPLTGIQSDAELRDVALTGTDVWVVGDRANAAGPIEAVAWRSHAGSGWTSYRPDPHPRGILNGVHATTSVVTSGGKRNPANSELGTATPTC